MCICIAPCHDHTSKALRYGTRPHVISQFYLHIPRTSANEMNHTCLCFPRQSWYSFTDPRRDGRLSWPLPGSISQKHHVHVHFFHKSYFICVICAGVIVPSAWSLMSCTSDRGLDMAIWKADFLNSYLRMLLPMLSVIWICFGGNWTVVSQCNQWAGHGYSLHLYSVQ